MRLFPSASGFGGALVSDDLVGDPVEDVEDEEDQREGGAWDGVDPLRSVHKLLTVHVCVLRDGRRRIGVRLRVFDRRPVLHTGRGVTSGEMQTTVL